MECPNCGSRTEVTETRGAFRDRRCKNTQCRHDFTTRENIVMQRAQNRLCARTRATQVALSSGIFSAPGGFDAGSSEDPEAVVFSPPAPDREMEIAECQQPGVQA